MDNINKNKLLKIIALSIFTLGIIIGTGIIITGLVKTNGIKNENKQIVRKIENKYESVTSKEAQEKMVSYIKETENKITNLESEISSLESEKTQIFMKESFSTNYYQKDKVVIAIKRPIPIRLMVTADIDTHSAVLYLLNYGCKHKPSYYLNEVSTNGIMKFICAVDTDCEETLVVTLPPCSTQPSLHSLIQLASFL